jgi:hypothetical protein
LSISLNGISVKFLSNALAAVEEERKEEERKEEEIVCLYSCNRLIFGSDTLLLNMRTYILSLILFEESLISIRHISINYTKPDCASMCVSIVLVFFQNIELALNSLIQKKSFEFTVAALVFIFIVQKLLF